MIIGSIFVEDNKSILLWALSDLYYRPQIIDIDRAFGNLVTLKVGVIDPNESSIIQVGVFLFNQEQKKQVTFEQDNLK